MRAHLHSLLFCSPILFASSAIAQIVVEPGDAVVSGDPAGSEWAIEAQDFVPFDIYVVAFDLEGDVQAVEWSLYAPAEWTLLDLQLAGSDPFNIGTPTNVIASTGDCLDGNGAVALGRYEGGFFASGGAGPDQIFCLGPASPSSFNPSLPGYVSCDVRLHGFGAAQGGQGIYPDGCLIVNPTNGPACPTLVRSQDLEDVLVPAGGTASVAYRIFEEVLVTGRPNKSICSYPDFVAVELSVRFDPAVLQWSRARLPERYAGFPLDVSVVAPGELRITLGPNATESPLEFHEPPRELFWLDFVLDEAGGTDAVAFEDAVLLDEQGTQRTLDSTSILISNDPIVAVEATSFGGFKLRYHSPTRRW